MKNFILTLLLVCLTAANATAAVTSVFNQSPIPGGLGLDNYVTNTWDITTDSDGWLSALLYVDLTTTGNIYQDPSENNDGSGNDIPPPTSAVGTSLEYDSYMTGGSDTDYVTPLPGTAPFATGNAYEVSGALPSPTAVFDSDTIDAAWGALGMPPSGSLTIARVTLKDTSQGYYNYRLGVSNNNPTTHVGGLIHDGVMQDPILTAEFKQEDTGSTPSGYISNTWHIDTLGNEWLSALLVINDVSPGDIYQDGSGDNNPPPSSPSAPLKYDSYMTGGSDTTASEAGAAPLVVGNAYELSGASPSPTAVFDSNSIDAAWGAPGMPPVDELMLGRITLKDTATGTYEFRVAIKGRGEVTFSGDITAGVMGGLPAQPVPPLPSIPGDADIDGDVDADDAAFVAANWQTVGGATWGMGDFNLDGNVNDLDATLMATNWTGPLAAAVPEPGSLVLLLGISLSFALFRRRV